ncbi:peptidyl-prolyl cis-trans isomerase fkbp12 [Phtheirospermum japonicum]|uniref:Peptidyl-prolyl cis-trans isomerase fkbp12 n=1 Tax=Phtheirospermum japonicum TaxID=374723 RepID=A0A830BTL9_9LAMI|nr:peptidyl-prolyl cis-trans isomerase fkbp12 [Phtheirospermum japonicum]
MLAHPIRAMGLEKEFLRSGSGPKLIAGQNFTIHYTDFGENGDLAKTFCSTKDLGQKHLSFQIGKTMLINYGMKLGMQVGEV